MIFTWLIHSGARMPVCLHCGHELPPRKPGPGRPRVYHPECSEVVEAFALVRSRVAERDSAGFVPVPSEELAAYRGELIALAWQVAPGRVGKARAQPWRPLHPKRTKRG